jgi:uncharacterized protein
MAATPREPTVILGGSESWGLLRETVVGHLAGIVGDQPEIFPVNYLVDHGSFVFRTAEGTKLANAIGRPGAFEVDGYDAASGEAWSVVVKARHGRSTGCTRRSTRSTCRFSPGTPRPSGTSYGSKPETVTRRRFHAQDALARHTPQQARRASHE